MKKRLSEQNSNSTMPPSQGALIILNGIKTMEDLNNIGHVFTQFNDPGNWKDFKNGLAQYPTSAINLPTQICIAMCCPIKIVPEEIFARINELLTQHFKEIPLKFKFNLVSRLVSSALYLQIGERLLADKFFIELVNQFPQYFAYAFLYLSASLEKPQDLFESIPIHYTKIPRQDLLTLYYYSVNLLLLKTDKHIKKAEQYLLYAFELATQSKSEDLLPSVIQKLSVASFLNHVPYSIFLNRLPKYQKIEPNALSFWDIDIRFNPSCDKTGFYQKLSNEIQQERSIRIVYDYAKTTTQVTFEQLQEACGTTDIQLVLTSLESMGNIEYVLKDGIITFLRCSNQSKIDYEQQEIEKLYNQINRIPSSTE